MSVFPSRDEASGLRVGGRVLLTFMFCSREKSALLGGCKSSTP